MMSDFIYGFLSGVTGLSFIIGMYFKEDGR